MKVIDDNIVHNHATIVNNIQTVRYDKKKNMFSIYNWRAFIQVHCYYVSVDRQSLPYISWMFHHWEIYKEENKNDYVCRSTN